MSDSFGTEPISEMAATDPPAARVRAAARLASRWRLRPSVAMGAFGLVLALAGTAVASAQDRPAVAAAADTGRSWQPDWPATADPADLTRLTVALPVLAASPGMRRLLGRILTAPNWPHAGTATINAGSADLIAARAEVAARLALPTVLPALAERDDEPSMLRRTRAEALLLIGDSEAACDLAVPGAAREPEFWGLLDLYCAISQGRTARAAGHLAALTTLQASREIDPLPLQIASALIGAPDAESVPDLQYLGWRAGTDLDPVRLAFLDLAAAPPPMTALSVASPARLLAIQGNPAMPEAIRVKAAELAAGAGALTPEALAALYLAMPVQPEELDRLTDQGRLPSGPRGRILMAHIVSAGGDPGAVAEALSIGLQISRAEGGSLPVALALLSLVEPASEMDGVALDAARAYYAAGQIDKASAWHALAQQAARDHRARQALARLWPLAVAAGATPAGDAERLRQWLEAELAVAGEAGAYGAAVVLAAFEALGHATSPDLWDLIPVDDARDLASLPSAALVWRLDAAVTRGATGPALLMALIALGDDGPVKAHPWLMNRVLTALVAIDLAEDARALAREAIWAAQI